MKKILLILLLSIPSYVYAFSFTCDSSSISYGNKVTCTLYSDEKGDYKTIKGNIIVPDEFDCTYNKKSQIDGTINNNEFNLTGTTTDTTVLEAICTLNKKLDENKSVILTIDNFKYQLTDSKSESESLVLRTGLINLNKETTTSATTKPKNTKYTDALLSSLTDENLDLNFSRFVTDYNIEVLYDVDHVDLKYTPVNPDSKVEIVGKQTLELGENIIDIYVTDPNNETVCYTLNIKRLARGENIYYKEKDATLAGLSVTGYNLKFDKDIYDYTLNVNYDVDELEVIPVLNYDGASYILTGEKNIKNKSVIAINVTSSDGTSTQKYTITINKKAKKKSYIIYYLLGTSFGLILIAIFIIIKISDRNKEDPILGLKHQKRIMNKGTKTDETKVPTINNDNPNTISGTTNTINSDNDDVERL